MSSQLEREESARRYMYLAVTFALVVGMALATLGAFMVSRLTSQNAQVQSNREVMDCIVSYLQVPPDQRTPDVLTDERVSVVCDIPLDDVRDVRSAFNPGLYES